MNKTLIAIAGIASIAGALACAAPVQAQNVITRNGSYYVRCYDCGRVIQVETLISQGANHQVAGTIIGGVVGGLLGHQVGGGRGKTLATIAGAVGGGYAGNRIGQGGQNTVYVIHIRMADGNTQRVQVQDAQGIRDGDIVRVDSKGNIAVVAQR